MGTRNLTMVIDQEGQTKVAQYGQWDGYPSGVGAGVLSILSNKELFEKLKEGLRKVRFLDKEGVDKDFIEEYSKNAPEFSNEPDNRTQEQKRWFSTYISRDLAEEVLINIANSKDEEIVLINQEETGKSGSWVEWSYLINLKDNTFGVYGYIDQEPIKVYSLNELPTVEDFISDLENEED
jgi:hypothetical protein